MSQIFWLMDQLTDCGLCPQQPATMLKSSSQNVPSTWLSFLLPRTHASPQTCHHSASSILAVRISCHVIAMVVFRKQQEEWRNRWIPKIGYYSLCTGKYVRMIFIAKCVTITLFLLLMQRFDGKAWFLLFCHPLKLHMILHNTGTVFFHCSIFSWGLG